MSNAQGTTITIFPTHVRVPNGMGSFKNVTLQDFHAEIGRVVAGQDAQSTPKISMRLPNECVSVRYNQHELELLMYFPESKQPIRYREDKAKNVILPAIVIYVHLKENGKGGWTVERVKWLCTDYLEDEIPNLDKWDFRVGNYQNHLWTIPLPNQYGDGNMCVGRNSYRSLYTTDLRGLNELYYHILIASPFNDDLWHYGQRGVRGAQDSVRQWLKILEGLDKYPWDRMPGYPQTTAAVTETEEEGNEDDGF